MSEGAESIENLSIRCPACRRRFSVDSTLMNRMVECGGCDTRFRISDDVIIHNRKFYPGERASADLLRFQRVPLPAGEPPKGLQTMRYEEFNHPERLGPATPQRIIAGIIGVAGMAMTALVLLFSSGPDSSISIMPLQNKLVVVGFVSLLGVILISYANPKARIKATLVGIMLAAGLISIPFFTQSKPPKATADDGFASLTGPATPPPDEDTDPFADLAERFGTLPLKKEQQRLDGGNGESKAFGIYIKEMVERNKYTAREFLIRDTGAGISSHLYPRGNDSYLMVLTDVRKTLKEVAEIAGKLGSTEEIFPEIGVVVVRVDNKQFLGSATEKLNDRKDPDFYDLNRRELESIDIDRVKRAVDRLATVEPSLYRTDITRTLTELLAKPGITFHASISRALLKWADDPKPAADAALKVLKEYAAKGLPAPEEMVTLITKGGNPEAIPTIFDLWTQNPVLWDKHLEAYGAAVEPLVKGQINSQNAGLRRSALQIIGAVGSVESLPALREILEGNDPELKVLAERAIQQIEMR